MKRLRCLILAIILSLGLSATYAQKPRSHRGTPTPRSKIPQKLPPKSTKKKTAQQPLSFEILEKKYAYLIHPQSIKENISRPTTRPVIPQAPLRRQALSLGMPPDISRLTLEMAAYALDIPDTRTETTSRYGLWLLIALYDRLRTGQPIDTYHDVKLEKFVRTHHNVLDIFTQLDPAPDFVYVYDEDAGSFQVLSPANETFTPTVGGLIDAPIAQPWTHVDYVDHVVLANHAVPVLKASRESGPELPLPAAAEPTSPILKYVAQYENQNITAEDILKDPLFHPYHATDGQVYTYEQILQRIEQAQNYLNISTITQFRAFGSRNSAIYRPERQKVHEAILHKIFDGYEAKVSQHPAFIMLGGRPGSGKSSHFEGEVYDSEHYVRIDVDQIRSMLPEYEGYNAAFLKKESTDIVERALQKAVDLRVNVVLDFTMRDMLVSKSRLQQFKMAGYRTEAHYLFVPRQETAKRALARFLNQPNGRYVSLQKILNKQEGIKNFDLIKDLVDAWSFSDNNVPYGTSPKLIARKGELSFKDGGKKWINAGN